MKKLIYLFLAVLIVACSGDDGNNNNQSSCPIYLDSNGITIKACEDASVGDTGVVNGVTYTVVNRDMLFEMIANNEDVSKVATTKVTNMANLFYNNSSFNQPIGNWDVSNVTSMNGLFAGATSFNQPIGDWYTRSCVNFGGMFYEATSFNQPLPGYWLEKP